MYTKIMKLLRSPLSHYISITGLYLLLALLLPANKVAMSTYHLNSLEYHVLLFVVVLPFTAIWFAAFYGYNKLRSYANAVRDTPEGEDFNKLADGCGWLAYSLPVAALVAIVLSSIANGHPGFHRWSVILTNYISLILPLIAFSKLSNGARELSTRAGARLNIGRAKSIIILFVCLGVLYCYLTFRHFNLISTVSADNAYFLPVWIAVATVIIPYLYAWFVGLLAAYEIVLFSQETKGLIYRRALSYMGYGIAAVIGGSIAYQYLSSVVPRTGSISLNYALATIYLFQLVSVIGYTLIALGATRLKRIEEV